MALILIYNGRTETIESLATFNEYCCIYDEICKLIIEKFHLSNLTSDYHMTYYDSPYGLWINFNFHVTKRIIELIRNSLFKTLKIRIEERRQRNITRPLVEKKIIDNIQPNALERDRCAHLIIWFDEHIGNPQCHKQLKRDCRAMINTNISFMINDNIDTLILYNSCIYRIEPIWRTHLQAFIETTNNFSCPFQCVLFTADNTDKFFKYLNISLELTRSLSIIISVYFAKEMLPIIFSLQQKQLLPKVLFLYILCSNVQSNYDWALGYIENNSLCVKNNLQFFEDEQALFVRLLNDISHHLTSEADMKRDRKETWYALQYYLTARQLFLNSLPWNFCYTSRELDYLDQAIKELEMEVRGSIIKTYHPLTIYDKYSESDDYIAQQCAEILEGI
ncbi:unnamed protein product [Adineta steineri]|uniref:Uncharacterized protein n=1 Tax=Adineta steineri TaxID=433720 RepID=A0A813MUC9_9BILA|nr:unnamed protein product [Adineta steineri]